MDIQIQNTVKISHFMSHALVKHRPDSNQGTDHLAISSNSSFDGKN